MPTGSAWAHCGSEGGALFRTRFWGRPFCVANICGTLIDHIRCGLLEGKR